MEGEIEQELIGRKILVSGVEIYLGKYFRENYDYMQYFTIVSIG